MSKIVDWWDRLPIWAPIILLVIPVSGIAFIIYQRSQEDRFVLLKSEWTCTAERNAYDPMMGIYYTACDNFRRVTE